MNLMIKGKNLLSRLIFHFEIHEGIEGIMYGIIFNQDKCWKTVHKIEEMERDNIQLVMFFNPKTTADAA